MRSILLILLLVSVEKAIGQYVPQDGFVNSDTVAIKIAEAVWLPIYGRSIYNKLPFYAAYDSISGIWTVMGTLKTDAGGVPVAKIQRSDGKIVYVWHGK